MEMNSTMTTIVPSYYNISNTTDDDGPYQCGQKVIACDLTEFIIYGVFTNLICLFGIFGNIVSMIVLSRPQMKSSINYLLIGLARSDTMLIIGAMLIYGLPGLNTCADLLFYYSFIVVPKILTFLYSLICMAQITTVYLTLAVTVERYIAICHPLKARSFLTYGRARVTVLVIMAFAFLYNLPKFWEIGMSDEMHWKHNVTVYCILATELRRNEYYITLYVNWLYLFVYSVFPFIALVIFNIAIYRQVRKANKDLQKLSHHQRSEIRLAIMLLCVVVVFLICNILPLASNICETFTEMGPPWWMVMFGNFLVIVNSSINFIIYIIFGDTFKKTFLKLFCLSWQRQQYEREQSKRESTESQTTNVSIVSSTSNIELISISHINYLNHSNTINRKNNLVHSNVHVYNSGIRPSVKLLKPVNSEPCMYYSAKSPSQMSRTLNGDNGWSSRKKNHSSTL